MINLETQRLMIRNFQLTDAEALRILIVQKEASPYAIYDSQWPTSAEEIRSITEWFANEDRFLAVFLKDGGEFIGFIGLSQGEGEAFADYDLGYCFNIDFQGKGYATEGCRAVIDYAFSTRGAERITSGTAAENGPSYRLLERLGFKKTGEGPASFRQTEEGQPIVFTGCAFVLAREDWI
jgi:[ribosomal protein S5]-alanine N-acetyltransferase